MRLANIRRLSAGLAMASALFPLVRTSELEARAQNPSPRNAQTHAQIIKNPLNDLLDEAQRDIDKSDFAAAIEPLQKVIAEKPEVAFPHFQLAYVFTALQRAEEARAEYERAIAIDPKMSEAYLNLGLLLVDKEPAAAVAPLKKAVELLPAESRPRFLLGVAQERSQDLAGAAISLEGASRLDPKDLETNEHLANLYVALKRPADAEAKFREVLESKPNDPAALLGLAKCLDARNDAAAVTAFQNYLLARPADAAARTRLFALLTAQQRYDEALAELDRADAPHGPTSDSLRERAGIEVAQKKWDEAISTLRKAVEFSPKDASLHGGLGRLLLQRRNFPDAEKELKLALALDSGDVVYLKDLSSIYYQAGNFAAALAVMDEIAKKETPSPFTWFIRGLCYDKLNQPKPALAAYQTFLSTTTDKNTDQVWQATERSKVLKRMLGQQK
jgi:Flp pilus assembly protein TadD